MDSKTSFEKNLAFFERMRPEWLQAGLLGKWVAIADETLIGHFDNASAAYSAGVVTRAGKQDFFIKQVLADEQPKTTPALLVGAIRVDR